MSENDMTPEEYEEYVSGYEVDQERIAELEAQVTRLQLVAKSADKVWEKADTDDEPWALRDMIDALEALQPGDLDPVGGGDE